MEQEMFHRPARNHLKSDLITNKDSIRSKTSNPCTTRD